MSQTHHSTNGHGARPKVLIPEKVSPDGLKMLQASLEVHERKGLSPEELEQIIGDYDALIVRSETKVTASLMKAGKKLRVVARAGVGVDNVDLEAATKLGVIVVNSPQGNINAAAEHTIALLMAVARNVGAACASLKEGKWERSKLVGVEVKGKTLSIIGLGKGKSTPVSSHNLQPWGLDALGQATGQDHPTLPLYTCTPIFEPREPANVKNSWLDCCKSRGRSRDESHRL